MNREIIRELILRYGEFLENNDYSETAAAEVFAEDASVSFATGDSGSGISEIAAGHRKMMEPFVCAHHNITNIVFEEGEMNIKIRFHMEAIHKFKPEIAAHTPGNLFIVNDRICAEVKKDSGNWKISGLCMETVFKRMTSEAE